VFSAFYRLYQFYQFYPFYIFIIINHEKAEMSQENYKFAEKIFLHDFRFY